MRLASLRLARSQNAVLHFQVDSFEGLRHDTTVSAFLQAFLHEHRRWGTARIKSFATIKPTKLCELSKLTECFLRHGFPFGIDGSTARWITPLVLFQVPGFIGRPIAPMLRKLVCSAVNGAYESQRSLLAVLRHCPNLEALVLQFSWVEALFNDDTKETAGDNDDSYCILTKLERLSLSGHFLGDGALLRRLRAPSLRTLSLKTDPKVFDGSASELHEFLEAAPIRVA